MENNSPEQEHPVTDPLDRLASQLALNYLDTSLSLDLSVGSEERTRQRRERIRQVFKPDRLATLQGDPSRNILVLGAGASRGAFGPDAFPGAREAMNELDRRLAAKLGKRPAWMEEEIRNEKKRLQVAYKYEDAENDFETHLAILSRLYPSQEIANMLAEMYGERYWPHLTFELIAHLLKHRFIDVVVNFNFDELLDQAIEEELGRSEYHYIISDGHCHSVRGVMVGDRLKVPIHIKPHGTARHRSTLRFTKEHYFALPDAMRRFMQNIIAGFTSDDGATGPSYRTNLISVGFDMGSVDLIQMLRFAREQKNPVAIYHLNLAGWERNLERLEKETGVADQTFIEVTEDRGLHGTLLELVDRISSHFRGPYRPRGVVRHQLIHALFFDDEGPPKRIPAGGRPTEVVDPPGQPETETGAAAAAARRRRELAFRIDYHRREFEYHRARLCAELAISLAKGNGRVDLRAVVEDRVGVYFDQLRDEAAKLKESIRTLRAEGVEVSHPLGKESLADVLGLFRQGRHELPLTGIDQNLLSAYPPELSPDERGEWLWKALGSALSLTSDEIQARMEHLRKHRSEEMVGYFQTLVTSDARDINANFRHRHLLLSNEPNVDEVIHTNLSFSLKFGDLMRSDWDLMLAVSEHGRVLDKLLEHIGEENVAGKHVCLVMAETDQQAEAKKRLQNFRDCLGGRGGLDDLYLPFWLHNHHMIIVLKRSRQPNAWEYRGGIRYDRQGLSNRINPVFLDSSDRDDLCNLTDSFFGYVWQAQPENKADWTAWSDPRQRRQMEVKKMQWLEDWWNKTRQAES